MDKYKFNCCVMSLLVCATIVCCVLFSKNIITQHEFIFFVVLANAILVCCMIMCCTYACFDCRRSLAATTSIAPMRLYPHAETSRLPPPDKIAHIESSHNICLGKDCNGKFTVVVVNPCFDDLAHTSPS